MQPTPDKPGRDDPGQGRRLALDVGTVRIGVAVSDRGCILATPVETISRETMFDDDDKADIDRILRLINEYDVVEVVIGLPRTLKGKGSSSVKHATDIASRVSRRLAGEEKLIPVRMADERLTTVTATQALRASEVKAKAGRTIIDQAAAVEILQSWLDERNNYLQTCDSANEVGDY